MAKEFTFKNIVLESGVALPEVKVAYETYGTLNDAGDNCILLPTYYTGTHRSYARLIGNAGVLNPERYFIVIPNMLGNGVSASPSNMAAPFHGANYPRVTIGDNVFLQHLLLTQVLKVRQIALIYGWSMGAMQAYAWAARHPQMVRRVLAVCGSARCWPLNHVFLQGVRAGLLADANFKAGNYGAPPESGLRAFGRIYAGWAYSAAFYRATLYRELGYESLESFLKFWEEDHLAWDANDLLAMLWTWQNADLGAEALQRITAKTIIMPCDQDMYFTLEEARIEAALIPDGELRVIYSDYGHCAGAPGLLPAETIFVEQAMQELLADAVGRISGA